MEQMLWNNKEAQDHEPNCFWARSHIGCHFLWISLHSHGDQVSLASALGFLNLRRSFVSLSVHRSPAPRMVWSACLRGVGSDSSSTIAFAHETPLLGFVGGLGVWGSEFTARVKGPSAHGHAMAWAWNSGAAYSNTSHVESRSLPTDVHSVAVGWPPPFWCRG